MEHQANTEHATIRDEIKSKVPWTVFTFAMTIILIALGWAFTATNAADEKANTFSTRIGIAETNLASIQATQAAQFDEILRRLDRIEKQSK